jgi:RNA polymerase sigma-70 factor (ECF subfamily)
VTTEQSWLTEQFEENRAHLRSVAYRMLGSVNDADDAVQDAWLRVSAAEVGEIVNMRAWLTTVVARISLNMLRSRNVRREELIDTDEFIRLMGSEPTEAEREVELADSVGLALLVVLDRLTPAERLAFVLHDMFDLPFDEIAPIVGRSTEAARQLASRARRRVHGASGSTDSDLHRRREIVGAFLSASRSGDFTALIVLLDPDVELHIDPELERPGERREVRGIDALLGGATVFSRAARFCRVALLDGNPGLVMVPNGRLARAVRFSFSGDKVASIEVIGAPERLRRIDVTLPDLDAG